MFNENLSQTAQQLVKNCNTGKEAQGLKQLYADNCISAEAVAMPGMENREIQGVQAIQGKHDWWNSAHEVHSQNANGPFMHGDDKFSVVFDMDITNKETGDRQKMQEVGMYTVDTQGKIVREEFFYSS
ncbi:MAG: SnoaL-like domain-containing protein [Parvularculaceae bacterium]